MARNEIRPIVKLRSTADTGTPTSRARTGATTPIGSR